MSRFATFTPDGVIEEIESLEVCKHRINDVCCNEKSDYLGWIVDCFENNNGCKCFEKEDGVIE